MQVPLASLIRVMFLMDWKKKHIEYHASSGKYLFESRGFPTDPRIEKIAGEWTYHFC